MKVVVSRHTRFNFLSSTQPPVVLSLCANFCHNAMWHLSQQLKLACHMKRHCRVYNRSLLCVHPPSDKLSQQDDEHTTPSEGPLSPEDISKFEEDGFVMLKQAFAPKVAAACRCVHWYQRGRSGRIVTIGPAF